MAHDLNQYWFVSIGSQETQLKEQMTQYSHMEIERGGRERDYDWELRICMGAG